MLQALHRRRSLLRIPLQHLQDQVDSFGRGLGHYVLEGGYRAPWEVYPSRSSKLVSLLPVSGWCAEHKAQFHELISFRVTWCKGPLKVHFCEDETHRKDINWGVIVR